jgi:hypothetical protein
VTLIAPSELCNMATKLTEGQASPAERRHWVVVFAELLDHLAHSTLGDVDLEPEPAVRDFISDRLLEDVVLGLQVLAVGMVLVRRKELEKELSRHLAAELLPRLDVVQQNLYCCLVVGRLPQRNSGTVIHEAAAAGNDKLLEVVFKLTHCDREAAVLDHRGGLGGGEIVDLEVKDDLGKTPLFRAIERGHVSCAKLLMERGADPNTRSKLLRAPFTLMQGDGRLCTINKTTNFISLQPKAEMSRMRCWKENVQVGDRHVSREVRSKAGKLVPISIPGALYGVPSVRIEVILPLHLSLFFDFVSRLEGLFYC